MALERIAYPTDLSTQADFSAHGDLIEAGFWDKVNAPLLVRDGVIPQGVVLQVGSVIYHGTSDTTITGTASDYVEITPDGATATAAYVETLTGVTWNAQYNGYYNSTATKLYIFDEGKALANSAVSTILTRYVSQQANGDVQIGRDLAVTGALSAATVNTGQGATNVYLMNQNVRTTDAVTHSTVTARGFDTFGGFHRGTGLNDTNLPVGSIVAVYTAGMGSPNRNEKRNVYLAEADDQYTLYVTATQLSGSWRARGLSGGSGTGMYLFQRTA